MCFLSRDKNERYETMSYHCMHVYFTREGDIISCHCCILVMAKQHVYL